MQLRHSLDRRGDYVAWCPFHPDGKGKPPHEANLSVSERGFYCHACGAKGALKKLAQKLGVDVGGGNRNGASHRICATYPYRDEKGNLLFEVVRTEPKGFYQRRPDGKGGWIANLNGTRRVLYRLPELLARPDDPVWIVEGEKDADRLAKAGLVATTNPGGAGKWRPEYAEFLRDRDVVIIPDNDGPGRRHAHEVSRSLTGIGASIKIVELPNLPPKGDVSDWVDAGHTVEELAQLARETPEFSPDQTGQERSPLDDLPEIQVSGRQLREVIEDAWRVVHAANQPIPRLFVRAGNLVYLDEQGGSRVIKWHTEASLYGHLARIADWVKTTKNAIAPSLPPKDVARDLLVYPAADLPALEAVLATPVCGAHGQIIDTDGYHPENGCGCTAVD